MTLDDSALAGRMRSLATLARPTAHELRGVLSSLHIHLELLSGVLDSDDVAARERRQRCLHVLKEACVRLQRIADGFLELAVLPAGAADVDLGALVAGVVDAVRPLASERRVRLQAGQAPPLVRGVPEPEACRQRLLEALLGALAQAAAGSAMAVEMAPDGRHVRVRVEGGSTIDVALLAPGGRGDA